MILGRLATIADDYKPKVDVDLNELADMFTSLIEGGILLTRVFKKEHLGDQILLYQNFLRLIFGVVPTQ